MRFPKQFVYIIGLGLLLLSAFNLKGQQMPDIDTTPKTLDILSRFDDRFSVMDSIIFQPRYQLEAKNMFDSIFFEFEDAERVKAVDYQTRTQVSEVLGHTGLELSGQVYARPIRNFNYDPDDPLVAYNAKAQAELQWNIFNSSIYRRASKVKEVLIQGELDQLGFIKNDLDEQILYEKQLIRYRHFGRLLSVINLHMDNINLLMETQMYLLEHGKISGDDLLKLINEQSELERQLISIKADSVIREDMPPLSIAYITRIDTAGIFNSIKENNIELKKLGLRHDLLGVQRSNIDYLQTMNISPFARFAYYNRDNVHNTFNLDMGLTFRLPITTEVWRKRRVLAAKQDVVSYEQQILEAETTNGIYLVFHDLEIYNENILGECNRMKNLKKFLKMRTESYGNVDGEYSRINRLLEYNAYLQAWERLLEFSYRRDCLLLDLQQYLLTEPVSNYIEFKDIDTNL